MMLTVSHSSRFLITRTVIVWMSFEVAQTNSGDPNQEAKSTKTSMVEVILQIIARNFSLIKIIVLNFQFQVFVLMGDKWLLYFT